MLNFIVCFFACFLAITVFEVLIICICAKQDYAKKRIQKNKKARDMAIENYTIHDQKIDV